MKREARVDFDTGAELMDRNEVVKMAVSVSGLPKTTKVHEYRTDGGYSSFRFSLYDGDIDVSVDRTADGLYRLKTEGGRPKVVRTANFTDEWPELVELYEFLLGHCAKQATPTDIGGQGGGR